MDQELVLKYLAWIETLDHKGLVRFARHQTRRLQKLCASCAPDDTPETIERDNKILTYLKKFTHEKPSMYSKGRNVYFQDIKEFVITFTKIWFGDETWRVEGEPTNETNSTA